MTPTGYTNAGNSSYGEVQNTATEPVALSPVMFTCFVCLERTGGGQMKTILADNATSP